MSVTSGFFNSVNHDRLYDAEQVSSLFDGIIIDGVYQNYGDGFRVVSNSEVNDSVIVKTGRAWFDHTWTYNDSDLFIQLDPPNTMLQRVDAIVIDVNREQNTRKNDVLYIKGTFGQDTPPELVNTDLHKQYPLAYISFPPGESAVISQSRITNKIGSEECPVATGVLNALNLDMYYQQLKSEFDIWWNGIKDTLDENTVTKLQNQINELKTTVDKIDESYYDVDEYTRLVNFAWDYSSIHTMVTDSGYTATNNLGYYFLPDNTLVSINRRDSSHDGYVFFINPSERIVTSVATFETKTSTEEKYITALSCDFDSFPCKITYLIKRNNLNSDKYITSHVVEACTLTITEDHTASLSRASATITESIVSSAVTTSQDHSIVPAYFGDGSSAMMFFSAKGVYNLDGMVYFGVKISKDGAIAYNPTSTLTSTDLYSDIGLSVLFYKKNGEYIYGTTGKYKQASSGPNYFIDPTTLQIVKRMGYTEKDFASAWPDYFLDIYRPNSKTVYSYKAPDALLKFSSDDYTYETIHLKPNIYTSSMAVANNNHGIDSLRILDLGEKKYILRRYRNDYETTISSCSTDKAGFEVYLTDLEDNGAFGYLFGGGYDSGSIAANVNNFSYDYATLQNRQNNLNYINAGPAYTLCAKRAILSEDKKHIYAICSFNIGMIAKPMGYNASGNNYANSSAYSPFESGSDDNPNTASNNVTSTSDYLFDIYIGG